MLTKEEIESLDKNGYMFLGQLLTEDMVNSINEKIDSLLQVEGENAGSELYDSEFIRHPKEVGADRLADLVNKGAIFDMFYNHPRVLAAIRAVLGSAFKLSSLNYRAAQPGKGLQNLHVDWKDTVVGGNYKVCNTIWLLDDFTPLNGATRIVPGSHKNGLLPNEGMKDPALPHPDEILIEAPAGSVFVFNSHVWHGGTTNHTAKPRRCIHSYFCALDQPQQIDQRKYITTETKDRLSKSAQEILDVL